MLKIGLTGGIGSGKSTAAALIREAGYPVIDSDQIARAVLDIYPEIKEYIRREYGEDFVKDGQLDRRKLAGVVFKDPAKLKAYQCVIMPYIILEIRSRLDALEQAGQAELFLKTVNQVVRLKLLPASPLERKAEPFATAEL